MVLLSYQGLVGWSRRCTMQSRMTRLHSLFVVHFRKPITAVNINNIPAISHRVNRQIVRSREVCYGGGQDSGGPQNATRTPSGTAWGSGSGVPPVGQLFGMRVHNLD